MPKSNDNNTSSEIQYFEIYEFDFRFIEHVKNIRESLGISQRKLSGIMGLAGTFVGKVESFNHPDKYSPRHMALLAKAFGYKNMTKLFNFPVPEHDWVRLTLRITPALKNDGTPSKEKNVEVIKVEPWVKTENKKEK